MDVLRAAGMLAVAMTLASSPVVAIALWRRLWPDDDEPAAAPGRRAHGRYRLLLGASTVLVAAACAAAAAGVFVLGAGPTYARVPDGVPGHVLLGVTASAVLPVVLVAMAVGVALALRRARPLLVLALTVLVVYPVLYLASAAALDAAAPDQRPPPAPMTVSGT